MSMDAGSTERGSETSDTVHGRLLEATHISGYSFERACDELAWLLDGDRWQTVGPGYTNINDFLATVDLSAFNLGENRPKLVKRIKELQPFASQRAIGKAVGAGQATVSRDLADSDESSSEVGTAADLLEQEGTDSDESPVPDSGRKAAQTVKRRRAREQRDADAEHKRQEKLIKQSRRADPELILDIREGDFREVLSDLADMDAVITDPPYSAEFLPLLPDLAAWADKVLKPDGVLAVLFGQTYLPEVYRLLDGHRPYRWTACYLAPGNGYVSHAREVQSNWKPLLVYGGGPRFSDVIDSDDASGQAKKAHPWGQDYGAFHVIIERLTERGQTVADPFMGSGTTLAAARALGRHAIGSDNDPAVVAKARKRLA